MDLSEDDTTKISTHTIKKVTHSKSKNITAAAVNLKNSPSAYNGSVLINMLEKRKIQKEPTILLATDIDNTFLTNFHHQLVKPTDLMVSLIKQHIPVAYITGTALKEVIKCIEKGDIPAPAVVAPYVGTELWVQQTSKPSFSTDVLEVSLPDGTQAYYLKDNTFNGYLQSLGYDRRTIVDQGYEFINYVKSLDDGASRNDTFDLAFQEDACEQCYLNDNTIPPGLAFKVSFFFFAASDGMVETMYQKAKQWFGQQAVICEELTYNQTLPPDSERKRYCLDILPITKASTVDYLESLMNVDFMVVAGDSGNDIKMLTESGDMSIMVGGARTELIKGVQKFVQQQSRQLIDAEGFQEVNGDKLYYYERGNRRGPESIQHALDVLIRVLPLKHA